MLAVESSSSGRAGVPASVVDDRRFARRRVTCVEWGLRSAIGASFLLLHCLISGPLAAQLTGDPDPGEAAAGFQIDDPAAYCAGRIAGGGTGILSGLVTDSVSRFGLPGLEVRAQWGEALEPGQLRVGGPAQAGYISDQTRPDGHYVLCGIPDGPFRLIVSFADSVLAQRPVEPRAWRVPGWTSNSDGAAMRSQQDFSATYATSVAGGSPGSGSP